MIIETENGLAIERISGRDSLYIDSSRIKECIDYLLDHKLRAISINRYHGYTSKNLDFLSSLEEIVEEFSTPHDDFDFRVINSLHQLRRLQIPDNGRDIIDLSNFPNLESLHVGFSKRLQGLETCVGLRALDLYSFTPKQGHLGLLSSLSHLEKLGLYSARIKTLEGIENLKNLKEVVLYDLKNLQQIYPLVKLGSHLEFIEIDKCKKITDYEDLAEIISLKKLIISDSADIPSLLFIRHLPNLEFFTFLGTKIVDGDISPCERLEYVNFDNKKHYSHKATDFPDKRLAIPGSSKKL
jgi:hypothetical protein